MVARAENEPNAQVSTAVEKLYDVYPFPPETLLDEAPLGYNWRWHFPTVYSFCAGIAPPLRVPRILDAGCGTGESTTYLAHLNPGAEVVAIDLSAGALRVAEERMRRSVPDASRVSFVHKSIFDVGDIAGEFDYINSVGVIHHTPDPDRALRALAAKLAPGGICHIFVYAKHGRWEITLMQRALRLLRGGCGDFERGVQLGRRVFAALPDSNRLLKRENERWAAENKKDATFADMYLHPHEVDYDVASLFKLIDQSGLQFLGFSNPTNFDIERVFKPGADPELIETARSLPERELYELVELLDPESVTHFEFFLCKPPFERVIWTDEKLMAAKGSLSACVNGWPSTMLLDRDYTPLLLKDDEHKFLSSIVAHGSVGDAVKESALSTDGVRSLIERSVLLIERPTQ